MAVRIIYKKQNTEFRRQNTEGGYQSIRKSEICVYQRLSAVICWCLLVSIRGFKVLTLIEKTKPIRQPLAGNPKYEYLNPKRFDGCVLKKQTQF